MAKSGEPAANTLRWWKELYLESGDGLFPTTMDQQYMMEYLSRHFNTLGISAAIAIGNQAAVAVDGLFYNVSSAPRVHCLRDYCAESSLHPCVDLLIPGLTHRALIDELRGQHPVLVLHDGSPLANRTVSGLSNTTLPFNVSFVSDLPTLCNHRRNSNCGPNIRTRPTGALCPHDGSCSSDRKSKFVHRAAVSKLGSHLSSAGFSVRESHSRGAYSTCTGTPWHTGSNCAKLQERWRDVRFSIDQRRSCKFKR